MPRAGRPAGASPSPGAKAARQTPVPITASRAPVPGAIPSPPAIASTAAIAPSVETTGATSPTLPTRSAR